VSYKGVNFSTHVDLINNFRIEIPTLQSIVIANRPLFQWLSIGLLSMHILFVVVMRAV
jgi:hypothetical protein